ncbi:restriction endonuclease subunit S [Rhizobium laguerreae]|uniref:restriction endonuclease subunit S n=1 Tax=Rhizobium laguerreae TaxID=1076926 RepID=UPI001C904FAE|nr:restriction endonuclease subunit S [Rhizobium laguerreae]MBY3135445.1 hypothetical protein [Rhizobium laguerreae]
MNWSLHPLHELTDKIGSGSTPRGGDGAYKPTGIPLVRSMNVHDGFFKPDGLAFIDEEQARLLRNVTLQRGDVLINITGASVARSCILPERYSGGRVNQHVAIIRPQQKLDPAFLNYFLTDPNTKRRLLNTAGVGATREALTKAQLETLEIPLPPLDEQKRIAAVLDKADQLRQKRRQAIALLDGLTQSIFLEMFGDPTSNPRGWEIRPFGDAVKNENYKRIPLKSSDREKQSGTFPYYGASGIIDYVDRPIFSGRHLLIGEDGANLLSRSTDIAFIADGEFWVNNHAHVVSDNGGCNLIYLQTLFALTNLEPFITGSAQPKLNRSKLDSIPVIFPSRCLQDEFEKRVSVRNHVRAAASASASTMERTFSSLQHRAFYSQL